MESLPNRITKKTDSRVYNIGYKKVFCEDGNEVVLMLALNEEDNITKPDPVSDFLGYGVARSVRVLAVYDMWGYKTGLTKAHSHWDKTFVYEVGKTYSPENGIWYWPTFKQAQKYWLNAGGITDERYIKLVDFFNK